MKYKSVLKNFLRYFIPYGILEIKRTRECPICGLRLYRFDSWSTRFGERKEKEIVCPNCKSHPRHRKLWVYLKRKADFFDNKEANFLHIAPERCFIKMFKDNFKNYLTADLNNPTAMVKMDITKIEYPDESFDIIFCNHVLEYIPEDNRALSELYRVMKKGGFAIIMVPLSLDAKTYEDKSITTPEGREKSFGYHDHVRVYGQDFLDKLRSVRFIVEAIPTDNYLSPDELKRYSGINPHNTRRDLIFKCSK